MPFGRPRLPTVCTIDHGLEPPMQGIPGCRSDERPACLLAGALTVRLTCAFLATLCPGQAVRPAQHPAGVAQSRHVAAVPTASRPVSRR